MMASDYSRVPSFSSVACPPRLNSRTWWPVRPRGRSGMAAAPAGPASAMAAALAVPIFTNSRLLISVWSMDASSGVGRFGRQMIPPTAAGAALNVTAAGEKITPMSMTSRATADLCDALGEDARVLPHELRDFGGRPAFSGLARTLRVFEDNALVRAALESAGEGCVLVVDGRGSCRTALVGGNLGKLAQRNGWAGVVVWGAVRDTDELRACAVGIRALTSCPRKSAKLGAGVAGGVVTVGDVEVRPGEWLSADADGIVVCAAPPEDPGAG